jgi:acetoin utilization deacetylase AcuC-like enzyme
VTRTGLYVSPTFLEHDTGRGHPERPARLASVLRHLDETGLKAELDVRTPEPIALETLLRVHPAAHVRRVETGCRRGGPLDAGDTVVCPASFDAALRAAGAAVEAVDAVLEGDLERAFVACRPPRPRC